MAAGPAFFPYYAADGWQLNLYRVVPGLGPVRVGTYTKHGGLGSRLNLATVFDFSSNGQYRIDREAVKQSGQAHVYSQSFSLDALAPTGPPACNDCGPRSPTPPPSDSATGPGQPVPACPAATARPQTLPVF